MSYVFTFTHYSLTRPEQLPVVQVPLMVSAYISVPFFIFFFLLYLFYVQQYKYPFIITNTYSIQYSNALYMFVAWEQIV